MKKIIPSIVAKKQGGFVSKKKIRDNVMLVHEAIHSSRMRKEKGTVIKINMANTFADPNINLYST